MKKLTFFFAGLFFSNLFFSQDVFFSNTQQSLVYLNPSFSGSNGYIRNQTSYRSQWPNTSGPTYVSFLNSFDAYIKPVKGGVSFSTLADDQGNGTLKTAWCNLAYAQYLSLGKLKVIPSVQVGYIKESLDLTKLNFGDLINGRYNARWNNATTSQWGFNVPSTSKQNVTLSSGLLIDCNRLILGASVFNINQPDIGLNGFYKLPVRTCFNASYNMPVGINSMINFSGNCNLQMKHYRSQFNSTFVYKKVFFGLGYANASLMNDFSYPHDAFANIGLHLKKINVAYCYDAAFSKFRGKPMRSHEISFSLNFKSKKDTLKRSGPEFW